MKFNTVSAFLQVISSLLALSSTMSRAWVYTPFSGHTLNVLKRIAHGLYCTHVADRRIHGNSLPIIRSNHRLSREATEGFCPLCSVPARLADERGSNYNQNEVGIELNYPPHPPEELCSSSN